MQETLGHMCNFNLNKMEETILQMFKKVKEKKKLPRETFHRLQATVVFAQNALNTEIVEIWLFWIFHVALFYLRERNKGCFQFRL
jgi:hypothetical protein